MPPVGGGGGAETDNEKDLLAVLFPESVTCTVKENCPVWVVVPPNRPELFRLKPCGKEPAAIFH